MLVRLLTVTVAFALSLAAVEWSFRTTGLAPRLDAQFAGYARDPFLPFKPKPRSRATGRNPTDEFDFDYRHNGFGFRDVEHDVDGAPGTFRILGLGDSFTYGVGVGYEETYLRRLEVALNNEGTGTPIAIVKAGIPRFFPEPERLLLEHYGARYQPRVVLVGFLPNDVVDTFEGIEAITADPSGALTSREAAQLGPWAMEAYQRCHLCRLALRTLVSWRVARPPPGGEIYRAGGAYEAAWQRVELEFERMAALAAAMGARLVVVHIPQRGPWPALRRYPAARLSAWAAQRHVGFVDVLPAMDAASARPLYYDKDGHCTAAGHAVIADTVRAYLTTNGLVPTSRRTPGTER